MYPACSRGALREYEWSRFQIMGSHCHARCVRRNVPTPVSDRFAFTLAVFGPTIERALTANSKLCINGQLKFLTSSPPFASRLPAGAGLGGTAVSGKSCPERKSRPENRLTE